MLKMNFRQVEDAQILTPLVKLDISFSITREHSLSLMEHFLKQSVSFYDRESVSN